MQSSGATRLRFDASALSGRDNGKGVSVRNPKTGVRVEVPAKRIAFFKAGKELRDVVMKR
jgi:integration host factor subunit beta